MRRREGGVVGQDENAGNVLRVCEFPRIKGHKPFDISLQWFKDMCGAIGQAAASEAYPVSS